MKGGVQIVPLLVSYHSSSSPTWRTIRRSNRRPLTFGKAGMQLPQRMRGTEALGRHLGARERFIPAYAGNSGARAPGGWGRAVHPRVCGEQRRSRHLQPCASGSSPRMRGTGARRRLPMADDRFIPAYAGNRRGGPRRLKRRAVHPRVCGEQGGAASAGSDARGSSPRMRGTAYRGLLWSCPLRFIPAYAGNRPGPTTPPCRGSVHPRVCGEQFLSLQAGPLPFGSSPRMRGTVDEVAWYEESLRFIPAYAGNRCRWRTNGRADSVHPRVCGEQSITYAPGQTMYGSSPRMRGTGRTLDGSDDPSRFIPAYAGNRAVSKRRGGNHGVHPRVCGEQKVGPITDYSTDGSSPRMRGTVDMLLSDWLGWRFIPAYAGNRRSERMIRR